jgi:HlyD family secretion protein
MAATRSVRRWVFLFAAILIASSAIALRHARQRIEVTTAAITQGTIVHTIVATGDLRAVEAVDVGAQISGTVRQILVDYNSVVHAGDPLAKIDSELFEAQLREAQAKLAEADAARLQAQANETGQETAAEDAREKLARTERLTAAQIDMPSDLDEARITTQVADAGVDGARSQVESAAADVEQARAAVRQAQLDLERTLITSPIDGVVVARNVDVGQTVAATFQAPVLFTIASDLRRLQLNVAIDESDIGAVHVGQSVTFGVDTYPDERFSGEVSQIRLQPVAEETTQATTPGTMAVAGAGGEVPTVISYSAIVDVSNSTGVLRPGLTATVQLDGPRRENVTRVPNAALAFRPPADVLHALGQALDASPGNAAANDPTARRLWRFDGAQFTPIDVQVGVSDARWTEVASGPLRPGDSVVTGAAIRRP